MQQTPANVATTSQPAVVPAAAPVVTKPISQQEIKQLLSAMFFNRFVLLTATLYCIFYFFLVPALMITGGVIAGSFIYVYRFGGDVSYWVERTQVVIHQWLTPGKAKLIGLSPSRFEQHFR